MCYIQGVLYFIFLRSKINFFFFCLNFYYYISFFIYFIYLFEKSELNYWILLSNVLNVFHFQFRILTSFYVLSIFCFPWQPYLRDFHHFVVKRLSHVLILLVVVGIILGICNPRIARFVASESAAAS